VAAELEPLFGQLAEVERQCDSIQDAARRDAAAIDAVAAERADAIVAEANGRAGSERAAAVARIRNQAAADGAAELAAARVEAAAIRDRASQRMTVYVGRAVTGVSELIGAGQQPGPP
jgi:vacuolar-type H+-ATPase subunit E/Vma4